MYSSAYIMFNKRKECGQFLPHVNEGVSLTKFNEKNRYPRIVTIYIGRVYFIKASTDDNETLGMGYELFDKNNSKGNDGNYAILLVDVAKIPSDVVFYEDGSYPYGVFTYDNIHSDCIVGINYVNYDKDE